MKQQNPQEDNKIGHAVCSRSRCLYLLPIKPGGLDRAATREYAKAYRGEYLKDERLQEERHLWGGLPRQQKHNLPPERDLGSEGIKLIKYHLYNT